MSPETQRSRSITWTRATTIRGCPVWIDRCPWRWPSERGGGWALLADWFSGTFSTSNVFRLWSRRQSVSQSVGKDMQREKEGESIIGLVCST